MNRLTAFVVTALLCVPATAQQSVPQRPFAERELLEVEQDVDKALLREALMLRGHAAMKPSPEVDADVQQRAKEARALDEFIAKKKDAIIARADELIKSRRVAMPVIAAPAETLAETSANRQATIEKIENAEIDMRLLQTQISLLQEPLDKAVGELAAAEFAASNDETQRAKIDEARKQYDKIKARHVELSRRQQMEQIELQSLRQKLGMGGMGGGFR